MEQIEIRKRVLARNDEVAEELRQKFLKAGTLVTNLISSPGSGKTSLLEKTVSVMGKGYRMGALVGDIATERDANRLRVAGLKAKQILTGGACHLDARMVHQALDLEDFKDLDILFIENVGNLICPTSYELGEDFKVVLLSVTEGDDKPFKYPGIFSKAQITLITKVDLLPHVDFNLGAVRSQIISLHPGCEILLTSSKRGDGIEDWCSLLLERLSEKRRSLTTDSDGTTRLHRLSQDYRI